MQMIGAVLTISAVAVLLPSTATAQALYTRTDVREAAERIERHGDEFKHAFKAAMKDIALNEREKRVKDSAEDLEDEVDNLQKNYKNGRYTEARHNLGTAMLLASPINRFMLRNDAGAEASRAWMNLKADLNVLALGYGLPPLPDLLPTSLAPTPGAPVRSIGSAERISPRGLDRLQREVRHELVMLPYYDVFDNLAYQIEGSTVLLTGQVTRPTLKSDAEAAVRNIEGVDRVVNNIDVLPASPNDDRIRLAAYRAIYGQTALNHYALQAVPPIHIIVKNGNLTLEGVVDSEFDRNVAEIQARSVPGVFSVTDQLRVENGAR
jgi:hyperosmotically inducible protein